MNVLPIALLAAAVGGPAVDVSTLEDERYRGEILALTAETLTVQTEKGERREVPVDELLAVRFSEGGAPEPAEGAPRFIVRLTDGTQIESTRAQTADDRLSLESPLLGPFAVPVEGVASVRFDDDPAVDEEWAELRGRESKRDRLVIKKKGQETVVLDYLDGIVGEIGEEEVQFLFSGDEIPVQREKVFGIVFSPDAEPEGKPVADVLLHGSGRLPVQSIGWQEGGFRARLLAGPEVTIPPEAVRELDFSLGKVRYLSQMEPRDVEYTPFFDVTFKYRRDANLDGAPLQLGEKQYARGLWIHSRTRLTYRLGGEYRRLKAVMGIDYEVARKGNGDVHVVISGDGETLLEADVRAADDPRPIDLDVSGVRDLEILVDFGGDGLGISDWLDLADARVIK